MSLIKDKNFFADQTKISGNQNSKINQQQDQNRTNDKSNINIFAPQQTQGAQNVQNKFDFGDKSDKNNSIFNMAGNNSFGASMGGDTLEIGGSKTNWSDSMDIDKADNNDKQTGEAEKTDKQEKTDKAEKEEKTDKKGEKSEKDKMKNTQIANNFFKAQNEDAEGAQEEQTDSIDFGIEDEAKTDTNDKFGNTISGKDNKELLEAAKKVQRATGKSIVESGDKINMTELKNALSGMKKEEQDEITGGKTSVLKQAGAI